MLIHLCWQPPLWTWHSSISVGKREKIETQKQAEGERHMRNSCNLSKSSHYEKKLVTRLKPEGDAKMEKEFNAGFRIKTYLKKANDG